MIVPAAARTRSVVVLLVFVVLAAPTVAGASLARPDSNSVTYPDSIGEDSQAPDITSTTVSNDDNGKLTFRIAISNRPALTPDMVIAIVLDSDHNPATGDPQGVLPGVTGTDYLIQLVAGSVDLFKWSGSGYTATIAPSLIYSYDSGGATITIDVADIGNTRLFDFADAATSGVTFDQQGNPDFSNARSDTSPDPGHGVFTYQVLITTKLRVAAFSSSPKPARAGKAFSVGLAATVNPNSTTVETGTLTCAAHIGAKTLRLHARRFLDGIAICTWTIPKDASGKQVRGQITLSRHGSAVSRSFTVAVL